MTEERDPIDLTNCDREPIHIPGSIQPHGVLLVMTEPELVVIQVSENVVDHIGMRTEDVLTRPLSALFDRSSVEAVRTALSGGPSERANAIRIVTSGKPFDAIVHRRDGAVILELEPASAVSAEDMEHHPLRQTLIRVQDVGTVRELANIVVEEVKRVTGFDRVMFYRFNEVGDGSVDAESVAPGLEPYLGLHYPAPTSLSKSRQLYLENRLRIIADARSEAARIVPTLRPDTGAPLDLSFAVLRSVSPIHLEYMANMGLRASMSIALVVRDRLWGLISCANHTGPRPSRSTCAWRVSFSVASPLSRSAPSRTGKRLRGALRVRPRLRCSPKRCARKTMRRTTCSKGCLRAVRSYCVWWTRKVSLSWRAQGTR
jgi:Bacteriophytochrome (light-regulated signal transduction histidine kinase)